MEELNLKQLTRYAFSKIYREHLRRDFADDERKPCAIILRGIADGSYACYGIYARDSDLIGYAVIMFAPQTGLCLLDYLAVTPKYRGKGYGTKIMNMLHTQLYDRDGIVIEYEHTEGYDMDDERCRRERFYIGAGMRRTGMDLLLYGVRFQIGYIPYRAEHADAELKRDIIDLYKNAGYRKFDFIDEI